MALNSTPRRRFGVALGVVLTGVTAGLIGFAGVASAHTPQVNAECKGDTTTLTVDLTQYVRGDNGETNHVKVLDGATVLDDKDFQQQYQDSFDVSGAVDHTFTVSVKAWDDPDGSHKWTKDYELSVKACVTPPPPPPTTSTTEVPPTTTSTEAAPVVATTTSPAAPAAQGGPLAETGASTALPLGIAGVLILGGVGALFVVRRRSNKA